MSSIEERNFFKIGDEIEFFGPNTDTTSYRVENIYDENDNALEKANMPRMIVKIPLPFKVYENDLLRVKIN
mgnify:CR=1 FL=1